MVTLPASSLLPLLAILVPAVGGLIVFTAKRWHRGAGIFGVGACAVATLAITLLMAHGASVATPMEAKLFQLVPPLWVALRVDAMGALFAVTIAAMFVLALVHAVGYLPDDRRQWCFHGYALASLGAMMGVALAANMITLLLFYELFSLLAYPLIVHERTPSAFRAGVKYLVYIFSGGALIFCGVVLVQGIAASTEFLPGGILQHVEPRGVTVATWWLLLAGFGVKAALMPLHGWVPDAHPAAPAPFSALLSGVMVAAGIFGILRFSLEIFGPTLLVQLGVLPWLAGIASVAVLAGAVLAVPEDDLKRRLAWSTISQMAYVTLALSLLHPTAFAGALVHITHHAFFKGGLFFCAGMMIALTGVRRISQMRGLHCICRGPGAHYPPCLLQGWPVLLRRHDDRVDRGATDQSNARPGLADAVDGRDADAAGPGDDWNAAAVGFRRQMDDRHRDGSGFRIRTSCGAGHRKSAGRTLPVAGNLPHLAAAGTRRPRA